MTKEAVFSHGAREQIWRQAQGNFSGAMEALFVLTGVVATRVCSFMEVQQMVPFVSVHLTAQLEGTRICVCLAFAGA